MLRAHQASVAFFAQNSGKIFRNARACACFWQFLRKTFELVFWLAFLRQKMTSISKGHDNESPGKAKISEWNGCGAISHGRWYVHSSAKSNAAYSAFLLISPFRAIGRGFPLPYISERKPSGAPRGITPASHRPGHKNAPKSAQMRPCAQETPPTFGSEFWCSPKF